MSSKFPITGLVLAGASLLAHADATLKTMSPQGEVALVRQVRATFSESMVKFGDPRLPAPLDVACRPDAAQGGTGRWVDDKTWVFDFAKDVPPGTTCRVTPHPGIRSVAGAPVAAAASFDFSTGGGETFPIGLAVELKRLGYGVTFFDFHGSTPNPGHLRPGC